MLLVPDYVVFRKMGLETGETSKLQSSSYCSHLLFPFLALSAGQGTASARTDTMVGGIDYRHIYIHRKLNLLDHYFISGFIDSENLY